ncbi:uncharacterized protein [Misgurnus anguillicaudatus]|uniref:uncharacterized protein isoform X2 n=1 Tax=Misgurnus anguillicaudatus TaxID=75329 RepID=UPI003CCF9B4C
MVLILCIAACGSAFLFSSLIYCTSSTGFIVEGYFNQRGSVVLPCFVDPQFMRKGLKVKWSKSGLESPVCVYQDGDDTPEIEHQDYQDRVKFFTEFISNGNLSLLLKNLTAEDEGQYTCTVYRQQRPVFLVHMNLLQNEQEFTVEHSCDLVVFPRDSVVLPCFIDPSIMTEDLEVEWRRSDSQTLVNLYEVGNIRSEVQHQNYHDRAHFFTEDIQLGNFSLKLKNLTAEDEGQYTCEVKSGEHSVFLTSELVPRQIDRTAAKPFEPLGYIHMFLPNIIMFVAFVLWGLTEGFLYETIFCCALCLLRPLMLIYVAPYVKDISGAPVTTEFAILTIVYVSVFFRRSWETVVHFTWLDKAFVIVMFGLVLLISLIVMSRKFGFIDVVIILFLPVLQLTLMFFTFRAASRTGLFVIVLFPLFLLLKFNCLMDIKQSKKRCINLLNIAAWIMLMFLMNALVIYFYVTSLEDDTDFSYRKILYVFGSVGVVLIIAVALMTELILKTGK